ncbi:MAG TPA: glucosyl-3-phosphoglycerate synthase [Solirubrobacteraceae bacterium]|nr:glucosyl-3-phosphoglycerate synthase [Solirubrobacteraceae bacterium]
MRTYDHGAFTAEGLAAVRERTISVCLPARDEAATIGPILERLLPLRERGAIDQVVVVDDSGDGTGEIAERLGAEVHAQSALMPDFGPVRGKGDAMWRALSVLTGDVVCYLDADTEGFGEHFALGLVGPVACGDEVQFVKGFYRRPWRSGGTVQPNGGGRVTELLARPLLGRFFPELAGFHQPLAGEIAARRDLLESLPFATGYAVDVALLIDAWRAVGVDALAQVDLVVRQNRHQPLGELGPMAEEVLAAVAGRLERDGRLAPSADAPALLERPPMRDARHRLLTGGRAGLHSM